MLHKGSVVLAVVLVLAACGTTTEERALSGAGVGAAGGAVVGAVTGLSVLEGALIGAGVGGITGALSDPGKIDLGRPLWNNDGGSSRRHAARERAAEPELVRSIQSGLWQLGYDVGPSDGIAGPMTRGAIRAYQRDHGLAPDGEPTRALALHIRRTLGASEPY